MAKVKSNAKVKVQARKKPVKPSLGKGSGGFLSARIVATVNKIKTKKDG